MHKQSITLASLLTLSAMNAYAADVTLEVEGTIAAGACVMTLENGGVADFGVITLNSSGTTSPEMKAINGSVSCAAETLVAIAFADNRPDSISPDFPADANHYGLGFDRAGNPIGAATLGIKDPGFNTDTGNTKPLISNDLGTTWARVPAYAPNNVWFASALGINPSELEPQPFTTLAFTVEIFPSIAPKTSLDMSRGFDLDGSITLSLIYL